MSGPTALITGSTSGIGKATARALAEQGAKVIMVGRNPERGQRAADEVAKVTSGRAHFLRADLSSLADARQLAETVAMHFPDLSVLVNNIGGVFKERQETSEGLEMSLALNHLGPLQLTQLLLSLLKQNQPSRVVFVTSNTHRMVELNLEDLQGRVDWKGFHAYGQAKLLALMSAFELARELEGNGVTVSIADPGGANTGGLRRGSRLMAWGMSLLRLTPEKAARSSVYLAISDEAEHFNGVYLTPKLKVGKASQVAYDKDLAEGAHTLSLALLKRHQDNPSPVQKSLFSGEIELSAKG